MTSRKKVTSRGTVGFVAGVVAVILLSTGVLFAVQQQQHRFDPGGSFAMEDTAGKPVTQASLLGKPSALFFGFTACPDTCPTTLVDLTDAMRTMGSKADDLNVVFVSVDPQRDTPEALGEYLTSFDPRIKGFTGTDAQVAAMARAYHILYQRVPLEGGGYTMDHTAAVLTFDRYGRFVDAIPFGDKGQLLKRLTALVTPVTN